LHEYVARQLATTGGIRRGNVIGRELHANRAVVADASRWREVVRTMAPLVRRRRAVDSGLERTAARFLDATLAGLGPKQARNLLQMLGLTQYEIPVDSRVTKWLADFGFPMPLSAAGLADRHYYEFVLDAFQEICAAADVLPCLMDAAIFASFDRPWSEEELGWL